MCLHGAGAGGGGFTSYFVQIELLFQSLGFAYFSYVSHGYLWGIK